MEYGDFNKKIVEQMYMPYLLTLIKPILYDSVVGRFIRQANKIRCEAKFILTLLYQMKCLNLNQQHMESSKVWLIDSLL